MPTANDLLALAYRLVVLTFDLGVLIYALPVPVQGLKRWAPRLIQDSILAFLLIAIFDFSFRASNTIAAMLGGSWQLLHTWISSGAAEFIAIKTVRFLLELAPDPTGVSDALAGLMRPLDRLATTALYFIGFIAGLAYLVETYGRYLAALGLVLYSAPFRIARAAGAWLFSFAIVFSAGLQVLPVLVVQLGGTPASPFIGEIAEKGLAIAEINVTGPGGPLWGELHVTDYDTGEEYAVYEVSNGSAVERGVGFVAIPSKPRIAYELEYMAVTLYLAPYPANASDYDVEGGVWRIDLYSPHAVYARPGILAYTNGQVVSVNPTSDGFTATLSLGEGQYVAVRYADTCTAEVEAPGLEESSGEWYWRGVHGALVRYVAGESGNYTVQASLDCSSEPDFSYETHSYGGSVDRYLSFLDLDFVRAFILYWFTIPLLYTAMLGSITTAIARLLGGRERLPVRIF